MRRRTARLAHISSLGGVAIVAACFVVGNVHTAAAATRIAVESNVLTVSGAPGEAANLRMEYRTAEVPGPPPPAGFAFPFYRFYDPASEATVVAGAGCEQRPPDGSALGQDPGGSAYCRPDGIGSLVIDLGDGDDTFMDWVGGNAPVSMTAYGGAGNDRVYLHILRGTGFSTTIYGGPGNDDIGGDVVFGEDGDDKVSGWTQDCGPGADTLDEFLTAGRAPLPVTAAESCPPVLYAPKQSLQWRIPVERGIARVVVWGNEDAAVDARLVAARGTAPPHREVGPHVRKLVKRGVRTELAFSITDPATSREHVRLIIEATDGSGERSVLGAPVILERSSRGRPRRCGASPAIAAQRFDMPAFRKALRAAAPRSAAQLARWWRTSTCRRRMLARRPFGVSFALPQGVLNQGGTFAVLLGDPKRRGTLARGNNKRCAPDEVRCTASVRLTRLGVRRLRVRRPPRVELVLIYEASADAVSARSRVTLRR